MGTIKYAHTNIVARDWRALAQFYQQVFDCEPIPPERDYRGDWINKVTAITGPVEIKGIHLRLPGHGPHGPTLEIFQYNRQPVRHSTAVNQPGFAHIAFHVDDVTATRSAVLAAAGNDLGQQHSMQVAGAGNITLIYMTDPEGNVVELQHWGGNDE